MNQPLAWDPVVIQPPSTSTAEEENDNGENYFLSGGALGASGASPATVSAATEATVVMASAGRESPTTQQAVGGNSSLIRPRQGSSVGLSQAGTRPWTRVRERDSSLGSSVSRPRLVGGVDEEEEGEACFEVSLGRRIFKGRNGDVLCTMHRMTEYNWYVWVWTKGGRTEGNSRILCAVCYACRDGCGSRTLSRYSGG